jgi:predicted nucleic acid-binding protein
MKREPILTPDIALPEVLNALFVQQHVLHLIDNGPEYLDALCDFVDAGQVRIVKTSRELLQDAYRIAARNGGATYDCLFIALALSAHLDLRTKDQRQGRVMEAERSRTKGHETKAGAGK